MLAGLSQSVTILTLSPSQWMELCCDPGCSTVPIAFYPMPLAENVTCKCNENAFLHTLSVGLQMKMSKTLKGFIKTEWG